MKYYDIFPSIFSDKKQINCIQTFSEVFEHENVALSLDLWCIYLIPLLNKVSSYVFTFKFTEIGE